MNPASDFLRVLVEIARGPQSPRKTLGRLALALLQLDPEQVRSRSCSRHLTLRRFKLLSGDRAIGLTLKQSRLEISGVVWQFECNRSVRFLKERFPKLSLEEAEAALRLTTLIFNRLEHICKRPRRAAKPWDRKAAEHEAAFLRSLIEISRGPRDRKAALARLTSAVLLVGSETDDNLNCVRHLSLGEFSLVSGRRAIGLELKPSKLRLAEVLSVLECGQTVRWLMRHFTKLSRPEAWAVLRLMALTFNALEHTWEGTQTARAQAERKRSLNKPKEFRDTRVRNHAEQRARAIRNSRRQA